ncbi:MAG: glycine cleavage system protein H [Acidimicrobiales bacterium]
MSPDVQSNVWAGCDVPSGLLYDLDADVWVRLGPDGSATVGMTDVAQTRCGRLVQVSWKHPGAKLRRGRPLCVIESAKWVGPIRSPLSGSLLAVNEATFAADVAAANRDPYGAGWFARIAVADPGEVDLLANAETAFEHYRTIIERDGIRCYRCTE